MLWDPRKDIPYDPFQVTLDGLIDWLRTKPADEYYNYTEPEHCAMCVYLRGHGVDRPYVSGTEWGRIVSGGRWWLPIDKRDMRALPAHFNAIVQGSGRIHDWTYGAALERAIEVRASLEAAPVC